MPGVHPAEEGFHEPVHHGTTEASGDQLADGHVGQDVGAVQRRECVLGGDPRHLLIGEQARQPSGTRGNAEDRPGR